MNLSLAQFRALRRPEPASNGRSNHSSEDDLYVPTVDRSSESQGPTVRTTQPLSGVSTPSLPVQTAQSSIPVVKQSMYTVSSLEAAVLPPSLPKATIATPIRLPSSSLRSYAPTPYDYMAYHSHLHPAAALSDLVHSQWPSRSPPRTVAEYSRLPSSLVKDLHVPKRSPPPPPKRAGVDAGTQCGQDAETQTPIPLSLQQSTFPNANIPPVTTPIPVQVMETPMRAASPPKRPPPPVLDDSMPAPEMGENFNVIWPAWPRTPISPKQTHQSQPGSPLPLSLQRPVRESARMHREVQSAARSQRLATLRERLENVSAQLSSIGSPTSASTETPAKAVQAPQSGP